jgi:hypothetical protein
LDPAVDSRRESFAATAQEDKKLQERDVDDDGEAGENSDEGEAEDVDVAGGVNRVPCRE